MSIRIFGVLVLGSLSISIVACVSPDDDLTHEQQFFRDVTTFVGDESEGGVDASNATEWLFTQMRAAVTTNRGDGAVSDLEVQAEVDVEEWEVSPMGRSQFLISMRSEDEALDWAIVDYGFEIDGECCRRMPDQLTEMAWTYRNDSAREWLKENDYLDTCDFIRDFGKENDREFLRILGEGCRTVLEGGSVDYE